MLYSSRLFLVTFLQVGLPDILFGISSVCDCCPLQMVDLKATPSLEIHQYGGLRLLTSTDFLLVRWTGPNFKRHPCKYFLCGLRQPPGRNSPLSAFFYRDVCAMVGAGLYLNVRTFLT